MTGDHPDFGERSFAFACDIVRVYQAISKIRDFPPGIARQLLDAGTSIGANLAESPGSSSRRDLTSRFSIALREARETKFWLRLIRATVLAPEKITRRIAAEADELVAILTVSVRNLKGS